MDDLHLPGGEGRGAACGGGAGSPETDLCVGRTGRDGERPASPETCYDDGGCALPGACSKALLGACGDGKAFLAALLLEHTAAFSLLL